MCREQNHEQVTVNREDIRVDEHEELAIVEALG
jgi:hypothetical protein